MRLTVNELQQLVDKTIKEERDTESLKLEIGRVLGPVVVAEGKLHEVVAAANDRLDVLSRTGRLKTVGFDPAITSQWTTHVDPELRKFVARVCPEQHLSRLATDRNPEVRAAVANRSSSAIVKEMMKRFPNDDQLRSIFRQKKMNEAGLPKPQVVPMGHDPVDGKKRMGAAAKNPDGPDLSEAWYHDQAVRFMSDYGQNLEYGWEELAVRRFCSSTRATSGMEVDEAKLLKTVKKIIEEKEDEALERNSLRETLDWLAEQDENALMIEGPDFETLEEQDSVTNVMKSGLSGGGFISEIMKLFRVQEGMLPKGIRKYRLGEGNARQTIIPVIATLPHKHGLRSIDERALDMFCETWTRHQQLVGEPLRLEWVAHPGDMNKIGFTCVLK